MQSSLKGKLQIRARELRRIAGTLTDAADRVTLEDIADELEGFDDETARAFLSLDPQSA